MPKFLIQANYTTEGARGLAKDGGTGRKKAVQATVEKLGGKLESFYFAFGDVDVYSIADMPDNQAATAVALAIAQSGAVHTKTAVLITPEEVDQALKKTVEYRAPGK